MSIFRLTGLILAATLAATLALPAQAAPIYFYVTSPADSGTGSLRAALSAANTVGSGNVAIISFDANLQVLAYSDLPTVSADSVWIQGNGAEVLSPMSHRLLAFDSSQLVLIMSNLTLKSGVAVEGGCLHLDGVGSATLTNVTFQDCWAYTDQTTKVRGGAIFTSGVNLTMNKSSFIDNKAKGENMNQSAYGGAIYAQATPTSFLDPPSPPIQLTVNTSRFVRNEALAKVQQTSSVGSALGGAIHASRAKVSIADSRFRSNKAEYTNHAPCCGFGGAIDLRNSNLQAVRNSFALNTAQRGGALNMSGEHDTANPNGADLFNNTFVGNEASGAGGAIFVTDMNNDLRNNSFYGNRTPPGPNVIFDTPTHTLAINRFTDYDGFDYNTSTSFWNNLVVNPFDGAWCYVGRGTHTGGINLLSQACSVFSASGAGPGAQNIIHSDVGNYVEGFRIFTPWQAPFGSIALRVFADSGAVDAGNVTLPDNSDPHACRQRDGLKQPRPFDGDMDTVLRCDIGAFEWQREASIFANDFEDRWYPEL